MDFFEISKQFQIKFNDIECINSVQRDQRNV